MAPVWLAGDARRSEIAIAARGDSVATMADLEAGVPAAAGGGDEPAAVVPVHHVRRLTATLVDILRHVTQASGGGQQKQGGEPRQGQVGGGVDDGSASAPLASHSAPAVTPHLTGSPLSLLQEGDPEISPALEAVGLLDCASESSYDDKLSLSSLASSSTAATTAATALLKAAFVRDEYRGGCCERRPQKAGSSVLEASSKSRAALPCVPQATT